VGKTPAKPGLQFQRGFFIVPAACFFVNERAMSLDGVVCRASQSGGGSRGFWCPSKHPLALWQVVEIQIDSAILAPRTRSYSFLASAISAALRFQWEVTMERLTGPILYVLIAWGIVTAVFMLLLIRRSLLASHEDDQIFLDAAQEHMAREQRELVAKIQTLSRPLMTSGIASGALLLVLAGLWLYNGLKNF
jgi:hypothetical protein